MKTVAYRDWQFRCDPEATSRAYAEVTDIGPESCTCSCCRNFVAARDQVYPTDAVDFFREVGMWPIREIEVYDLTGVKPGLRAYCGWAHFIGEIIKQPTTMSERHSDIARFPRFEMWFSQRTDLLPKPFESRQVVQADFAYLVPWVLPEPEPDPAREGLLAKCKRLIGQTRLRRR